MALELDEWICIKQNNEIYDCVNGKASLKSGLSSIIEIDQDRPITVFPSSDSLLDNIVVVDDVPLFPIGDVQQEASLDEWMQNHQIRQDVCQNVIKHISNVILHRNVTFDFSNKEDRNVKTQNNMRICQASQLEKLNYENVERFLPNPKYSLVVYYTANSLLALLNQLVPLLISGLPVTVVSQCDNAISVSYLNYLLHYFGVPTKHILNHLISPKINGNVQVSVSILTESADIDSSIEDALVTYDLSGLYCMKIFVQESLRNKIERVIQHKLSLQFSNNVLFSANELFSAKKVDTNSLVNMEAVDFEANQRGISIFYYRTYGEVVKMVNYLNGQTKLEFVSIWCENSALAWKIGESIQSSKQILVNANNRNCRADMGWMLEMSAFQPMKHFLEQKKLSINKKTNTRWTNMTAQCRFRIVSGLCKNQLSVLPFDTEIDNVDEFRHINYYEPIGSIIIQLDKTKDFSTCLPLFCYNALVQGNSIVLIGTEDQLKYWNQIKELLNKQEDSKNVLQTIQCDQIIKVEGTSQGVLLLVNEQCHIQSLFIDQSQFNEAYYSRLYKRIRTTISISLPEFEMDKLVS